jgi:hypothetical protein
MSLKPLRVTKLLAAVVNLEVFMKFGLFICLLLAGQMSYAQTMRERKNKEEMLNRVSNMIITVADTRKDLQSLDVIGACEKMEQLFKVYPDHLMSMGTHLYAFDKNTVKATNQALVDLIFIHQQTMICKQGLNCEDVDPRLVGRKLKSMQGNLENHKKLISKSKTHYQNAFNYEYKF